MRTAYLTTLHKLAEIDDRIVSLVADNGLIVYDDFRRDFPDRYYNFGISEGNMVSAAAGMASCGLIPYCYTISAFLAYRSFEFIRDDVCFQNQNVKIVGIGSGTAYSTLGPSHHATEDIGVLRCLPNLTLFSPSSPLDACNVIKAAREIEGPVYVRLGTNGEKEIHKKDIDFTVGKNIEVKSGKDIAIFVTGSIISKVIDAAKTLEAEGISAKVIDVHTLKPFDKESVIEAMDTMTSIYTVEDHSIIGGLGSIVSETIAESGNGIHFKRIGYEGIFAKSYGKPDEVLAYNGLDEKGIAETIIKSEREKKNGVH